MLHAVEKAGYHPGQDVYFALDAATSEWYSPREESYHLPKRCITLSRKELCEHWHELAFRYPLLSLEDGMAEDDEVGWFSLTECLGEGVQLVGDDLFVTDPKRISHGAEQKLANAVLIKPNQIGTLSQTIEAVHAARQAGYAAILSHRSGETEDTTISDLAVALGCGQIKTGAPCRGERTAKYNRLLQIEQELAASARYAGSRAFAPLRKK